MKFIGKTFTLFFLQIILQHNALAASLLYSTSVYEVTTSRLSRFDNAKLRINGVLEGNYCGVDKEKTVAFSKLVKSESDKQTYELRLYHPTPKRGIALQGTACTTDTDPTTFEIALEVVPKDIDENIKEITIEVPLDTLLGQPENPKPARFVLKRDLQTEEDESEWRLTSKPEDRTTNSLAGLRRPSLTITRFINSELPVQSYSDVKIIKETIYRHKGELEFQIVASYENTICYSREIQDAIAVIHSKDYLEFFAFTETDNGLIPLSGKSCSNEYQRTGSEYLTVELRSDYTYEGPKEFVRSLYFKKLDPNGDSGWAEVKTEMDLDYRWQVSFNQ